jgi:hypothetical protein
MRNLPALLSLVASLLFSACGWKSDGLARLEELYPTPAGMDAGPLVPLCTMPDDPAAAAVQQSATCTGLTAGKWAVRLVQFGSINPSNMGPWNLTLADHFLAVPSADKKSLELSFCAQNSTLTKLDGSPVALGATKMPDLTRVAIGKTPLLLPLPGDGTFHAVDVVWLWGVRGLANPLTDELPTDPNDAHVWDQDGDSNPGVTVHVLNPEGDRYMARRSVFGFAPATIAADFGWIAGPLTSAVTEHALAASVSVLKTVAPITVRTECDSVYQLRCVEAGYTCDQLITDAAALFRDAPR